MTLTRQVIAAVIERGGKYLVCQRPQCKFHAGLWEFPGGKLEPGETLEQAAQREMAEELCLGTTRVGDVQLALQDPASGYMINFVRVEVDGEPQLMEHSGMLWLTAEELLEIELAPSDRKFAEHLQLDRTVGRKSLAQEG